MIDLFKGSRVKINAITYFNILLDVLIDRLDEHPQSDISKVNFILDNAPTYAAKRTEEVLSTLGFKEEIFM